MSEEKAVEIVESAKFFVLADGSSRMMAQGTLRDCDVSQIQAFIKQHHAEMFAKWPERSAMGYFGC